MIETTIRYNINGTGRGIGGRGIGKGRIFGQGRNNKNHNRIYNIKTAKDSGGKQLKGFEFDNKIKPDIKV